MGRPAQLNDEKSGKLQERVMEATSKLRSVRLALLIARVMMASLAVFGGLEKVVIYSDAVQFASSFQIPFARILMPAAVALELGCAVLMLFPRYCRIAAFILGVWTFLLGLWFHRFWLVPASEWQMMIDSWFHHLVMTGGFIYVAVFGADGRLEASPWKLPT